MNLEPSKYLIYTDGASSGNPGPSGWGAVILGEGRRREIGGHESRATNNQMELKAVIEALRLIGPDASAAVHSDSAYVIDGITRYILKWRQTDFRKADKTPVENRALWEELDSLSGPRVTYVKVPAHSGNRENERANDIAQNFSKHKPVDLADAPLSAARAERAELKPLHLPPLRFPLYVVAHGAQLSFYRAWDDCRRRVEGRRGLRYKKCKSREELEFTLEKWGLRAIT